MPDITQKLSFNTRGASTSLTNLTNKLNAANTATQAFNKTTGKNIDTKGLKNAKAGVDSLTLSWKTMARIAQTQIGLRAFNLTIQALKDGVNQAKELGLAIEEIQTIMGRTLPSAGLQQQVLDLSDSLGAPALGLAEGLYQTLSNQVVDTADSMGFLTQATKLARVTASDTKSAVNALSSVMNSYGLAASEAEHIAGTLFKTVELGRLRLDEIGDIIGRVTPLTAAMGVEWEEAAAAIAVMTRQGVKADTAITQLRAIMTKIIRPTKEMRDIFHSWGVKDGKEAVEAFGGIGAVLKKLAVETGGSSEAMADLLRRVRTIVGQLSLMNDGGVLLDETMGKLKKSTNEVATQWEEFTQSDAYRLEKSVNEFKNSLTRAGTEALPVIVKAMEHINWHLETHVKGWKVLLGLWDTAAKYQVNFKEAAKKAQEEIDRLNKEHSENQKKRYEGMTKSQAQFYLDSRKQEIRAEQIRDAGVERATQAVKDQAKNVVNLYKSATKELSSFVDKINSKIKSNTEKIADINQKIADRKLQHELGNARNSYQKRQILESAFNKQQMAAAKALRKVGSSEVSKDKAIKANELATNLAEQAEEMAKGANNAREEARWHSVVNKMYGDRGKILARNSKYLKSAKPFAEQISKGMEKDGDRFAKLKKQYDAIYKSGDLTSRNEEIQKNARANLTKIEAEMLKIVTNAERADKFFKSLGLESNLPKITSALTGALDAAHKDWPAEIKRLNDTLAATSLKLKLELDPKGIKEQAAKDIGLADVEGESGVARLKRSDEAQIERRKQHEDAVKKIETAQIKLNTRTEQFQPILNKAGEQIKKMLADLQKGLGVGQTLAFTPGPAGNVTSATRTQEQITDPQALATAKLKALEAKKYFEILKQASEQQNKGRQIDEAVLQAIRGRVFTLREERAITSSLKDDLFLMLKSLEGGADEAKDLKTSMKDALLSTPTEAMEKNAESMFKTRDASEAAAEAARKADVNIKNQGTNVRSVKDTTDQYKTSMDGVNTSAGNVVTTTSQIGATASAQVAGVNSLTEAYSALAKAQAASAVGGTVPSYHGGPMARYFAEGGIVPRGQDRIPTALSRGETVINSRSSKRFFSELNAMNQGSQPAYREQGGPVTNVGDVNVTVNGGDSSQQTVRSIGHALRREIKRGTITLR